MATYYVMKKNEKYTNSDSNYMMPMINILPALIYSILFMQKVFPEAKGFKQIGIAALFIIVYMVLSYLPYISLLMNIASAVILVAAIWSFCDYIGNNVVQIIVKVLVAGFVGLLELAIFVDRTIKNR